jgi:hypothetical protein
MRLLGQFDKRFTQIKQILLQTNKKGGFLRPPSYYAPAEPNIPNGSENPKE